ncbi:Segment polarity protein dishevelled-like protein DVL-2 [Camelus dromedarius]|uniref:Segment polarity protein dishevelled-like protein DVL-2 n=1 Tax=Camelus dromedarius TaxID=9838 RepID=A0A5N4D5B5_CAMDR|nr:Segment polarity protein dishevelled-like protein DVL-2 [Camelus dromedarius]
MRSTTSWASPVVGQSNEQGRRWHLHRLHHEGWGLSSRWSHRPGDMLLQVNDMNFENMSNDDAVRGAEGHRCTSQGHCSPPDSLVITTTKKIFVFGFITHAHNHEQQSLPLVLTVAKCWDPSPQAYSLSREAVRPGSLHPYRHGICDQGHAAQSSDWKFETACGSITIPNAFLAQTWSTALTITWRAFLSGGRPASMPVGCQGGAHPGTREQITFSEQCYYVFGDLSGGCESL